jgi:WD40 repeat protein
MRRSATLAALALAACNQRDRPAPPAPVAILDAAPPPPADAAPGPARIAPVAGTPPRPGVARIDQHIGVRGLAFLRDGRLVSGGWDGVLDPSSPARGAWIWDLAHGTRARSIGADRTVQIAAAGDLVAVLGGDGVADVVVWDAARDRAVLHVSAIAEAYAIAIANDGEHVAIADGTAGVVDVWTIASPDLPRVFPAGIGTLDAIAFTPDGRFLVVGGAESAMLFDLAGLDRARFVARDAARAAGDTPISTTAVATSPDGAWIATGGSDGVVRVWDASSIGVIDRPALALRGHTDEVYALAFSGDGRVLASGSRDGSARTWSIPDGKLLRRVVPHAHRSATGTQWVLLDDGSEIVEPESDDENFVRSVALSFDGAVLAAGDGGGTIRFYAR